MKKALIIFSAVIGFLIVEGLAGFGLRSVGVEKDLPSGSWMIIFEALFLGIFLFLNAKFFKQKILFEHYHLGKGFGILWLAWLYLLIAVGAFFVLHRSVIVLLSSLVLTILVGCTEEFIFRGLIFGTLISQGKSLAFAIGASSVLFGLTHSVNLAHNSLYNVSLQMLYTIPMGVLLATLYVKSNNLIYAIILHAATDFSAFIMTNGPANSTSATPMSVLVMYMFIALIVFCYLITGDKQMRKFKENLTKNLATAQI